MKKFMRTTFTLLILICIFSSLSCHKVSSKTEMNYGKSSSTTGSVLNAAGNNSKVENVKKGTIRFVVMADSRGSDNGVNSKVLNRILQQIKKLPLQPEFIVIPGDLISGTLSFAGVKNELTYFKNIVTKYYSVDKFYPGIGNHEIAYGVNGEKAFGEVFVEFKAIFMKGYNRSVYYFDKGGSRFFMLNSDHPGNISTISLAQQKWIKNNMSASSKHNIFFFHEPAYPTGPHVGSSLDSNTFLRDSLWKIIDQSNSPIVFCGHEHFYTRRHINSDFNEIIKSENFSFNKNVYQVTVGSCGAPLYSGFTSKKDVDVPPISQYHFAVVDINVKSINALVYNIDGRVIDSFSSTN